MMGIDQIGPGGIWIVPFMNRRTGKKEALCVPDYRALIFLGKKNGVITHGYADVVKEKDEFSIEKGDTPRCIHKPALSNRGALIGAYAVISLPDGSKHIEWMDKEEIEKTKNSSKAATCGPWVDWYEEQAKKTVIKRAMKPFAGGNPYLTNAMNVDNEVLGLNLDKSPIAAPKEKEVKPESVSEARPTSTSAEQLANGEVIVKNLKASTRNGTSKSSGKPYRVWSMEADDERQYSTCSESVGKLIMETEGKDVVITSKAGQYGQTLLSIRLAKQNDSDGKKTSNDGDSSGADDGSEELPL
jgi:recombinational DNA repair protein RecT